MEPPRTTQGGREPTRFYTQQHEYYCGVDLHARAMYACVLDAEGKILVHRDIAATAPAFVEIIEPYRPDVAVAVECIFTWYWLADLCTKQGCWLTAPQEQPRKC